MKTIKATMPCQENQNSWTELLSANDDEDCVSYERRPMYLCTEHSYHKLSSATIKMLVGE